MSSDSEMSSPSPEVQHGPIGTIHARAFYTYADMPLVKQKETVHRQSPEGSVYENNSTDVSSETDSVGDNASDVSDISDDDGVCLK
jgi:hypothetical protein